MPSSQIGGQPPAHPSSRGQGLFQSVGFPRQADTVGGERGCHVLAWLVCCVPARYAGLMPPSPCRYTSPDFLYIRSWLPCIFFSGGVTVGNIGRQLANPK